MVAVLMATRRGQCLALFELSPVSLKTPLHSHLMNLTLVILAGWQHPRKTLLHLFSRIQFFGSIRSMLYLVFLNGTINSINWSGYNRLSPFRSRADLKLRKAAT